jgi:protein-disulfide isomerase
MSSRFAAVLVAIMIIFGGIFFVTKHKANTSTNGGSSSGNAKATNHVKGSTSSGVTMVEYGDFQCPACSAYYPIVKQVEDKYSDRVQFQFVNFPLYQIHQNAMTAHRAAEAASLQGKFWEMYDQLYTNHDVWANTSNASTYFEQYANQIGLNMTKFKQDANSSAVNDTIWADINKGNALGITGTPTFYLDGNKITSNPTSVDDFSKLIDAAIKAKTASKN